MRVLWLSHFLPHPPTGHGALQRSHNLLVEAGRRHEVHLVSLAVPGAHQSVDAREASVQALRQAVASVHVTPLPGDSSGARRAGAVVSSAVSAPSYWDRLFDVPALRRHLGTLSTGAFDLVHVDIVFLTGLLRALPPLPLALNHHNIESHLLRRRAASGSGLLRRWYFDRQAGMVEEAERTWGRRAGVNLVVSALDGVRLQELSGDVAVAEVPNGVDLEFFRPSPSVAPKPWHMVFAGGMDWFPNREAMVYLAREIWPALRADNARRQMTVVGRHPPDELVAVARADSSLRVTGFVDDVRPYLTEAPIYLCPIRTGGGTRLKILDALSMSRALVSTDLGVEGLGLEDGVHYLRANTPGEFVHQLRLLESDDALRQRLANAGRAFVEAHYSWHRIAQALDDGWERAVAAGPAR
jgi:glycosyltransferase involved in cell wall biosynthesis